MAKTLKKLLDENPKAKKHQRVIKSTLKALKELRDAGFVVKTYDLASPHGGSREPQDLNSRKSLTSVKMG
jgi:hypothetical protein